MKLIIFICLFIAFYPVGVMAQEVSGNFQGGSVIVGTDSTACSGANEGAIRYETSPNTYALCNGTAWLDLHISTTATATNSNGDGYFVITSGKWDGNLGGMSGANAKCLSDLTANDWMGKGNATVDAAHVYAFIASSSLTNNIMPNTTYFFAVSGDNTKGGASFTSSSLGYAPAPGNGTTWSGTNYFDGTKIYWSDRSTWDVSWWGVGNNSSGDCSVWTSNSSASTGGRGNSANVNNHRWAAYPENTCDTLNHLVCMVHP